MPMPIERYGGPDQAREESALAVPVSNYFGSMQPCEATTCQRPLWFTNTSVHRVVPLMSFPLYVPLSLLL